jgi:DNA-binding SARP family transcriptional activator
LDSKILPSDVADFTEALERGDLELAARVYEGPFLDDFHLAEAPDFGRWLDEERARFTREYVGALRTLARPAERRGDCLKAVEWWRRLAQVDRLSSQVAMGYMEALARVGERITALQYARVHEVLLRDELGATPDAAVTALPQRLRIEAEDEVAGNGRAPPEPAASKARRVAGRYLLGKVLSQSDRAMVCAAIDLKQDRHQRDSRDESDMAETI